MPRVHRLRQPRPSARRQSGPSAPVYVIEGGAPRYVLVPIEQYVQPVPPDFVDEAIAIRDNPATRWEDSAEVALRLAGERIARARKAQGLTQRELGERLNLPQSQISRIERNPDSTTLRTLKRVASALGVDVRALV